MGNCYYYHLIIIITILEVARYEKNVYSYRHVMRSYCRVVFRNAIRGRQGGGREIEKVYSINASRVDVFAICNG